MTRTVLVVDDSADGTILTERALSKIRQDIEVHCIDSGKGALEFLAAAHTPPSLILLDLKMPGLDGIATLKKMRADRCLADIPVVIITLSTLESELDTARHEGAAGIVFKSIKMDVFTRDLDEQMRRWIPEPDQS